MSLVDANGRPTRFPQRAPQQAARVGQVDKALEQQHMATGQAMLDFLNSYHTQMVEPKLKAVDDHFQAIDEYIQWQITPWHKKARMFVAATILKVSRKVSGWRKPKA